MTTFRGRRHQLTIDNQTVWLDSLNEATALERFITTYGFSGKWERPEHGIKHAGKFYSPDFELAINHYGNTARALVEVKEYRKNFTKAMVERMCGVASHYATDSLFLYAVKTDKWYRIVQRGGLVRECPAPLPGTLQLSDMKSPSRFVTKNYYGRKYYQSYTDTVLSLFRPAPKYKKKHATKKKPGIFGL